MLIVVFCLAVVAVAGAASARSPRLERLALRPADGQLAQRSIVALADLASGWSGGQTTSGPEGTPDCPWQNYSAFTLTGQAMSEFSHTGAQLQSSVQVFATHAQAIGDYAVDTKAGTATCEGEHLRRALGEGATLVSARQSPVTKLGERATAFRWVIKMGPNVIYLEAIEFVRGRAIGGLFAANVGRRLAGTDILARAMDLRLQPNVA